MEAGQAERALTAFWDGLEACYNGYRASVFETRARDLVGRAGIEAGARVLDLGTGTGIAAFEALEKVGPNGLVVGIDTSDGLLRVARREAGRGHVPNVEFMQTSMTSLALPDDAFDYVIGNYAVCCSTSYETTLGEAYRVLRSGGRLTYNHAGPHPHPVAMAFKDLMERHRVEKPSADLQRFREADTLVEEGWAKYKDPFVALEALKTATFREAAATISSERLVYPSPEDYLDYKLMGSVEFEALPPENQVAFRDAVRKALRPYLTDEGLVLEQEVLTFNGVK